MVWSRTCSISRCDYTVPVQPVCRGRWTVSIRPFTTPPPQLRILITCEITSELFCPVLKVLQNQPHPNNFSSLPCTFLPLTRTSLTETASAPIVPVTQNALPRPSTPLSPYQCVQGPVLVFRLQLASFFTVQILTALPIAERLQNSVKQPVWEDETTWRSRLPCVYNRKLD